MRLLIVEDEKRLAQSLARGLTAEGFAVETVHDGAEGLRRALGGGFDLIVLDIMLPGMNGYRVCAELRAAGDETPILMLTAKDGEYDEAEGLDTGADDYLTKPFETMELLARVEALLRRHASPAASSPASYSFGDVKVDVRRTEVYKGGEEVPLSAKEFQLLKYFLENRGDTLSRDVLLHEVWDYDSTPTTRTVDVHVAWLRQKLEDNAKQPKWILTVHGLGYKFAE